MVLLLAGVTEASLPYPVRVPVPGDIQARVDDGGKAREKVEGA
jgi:hypothetical protein